MSACHGFPLFLKIFLIEKKEVNPQMTQIDTDEGKKALCLSALICVIRG
jgi:hypothetical protein